MPASTKQAQTTAPRKPRASRAPIPQHTRRRLSEEAVLNSAERLFVERGYHRTAIDDIARQAGLTKGAVYFHFRDKQDVLVALLKRAQDRIFFPMFHQLEQSAMTPVEQLAQYVHGWGKAAVSQRNTLFLPILMSFEFLGAGNEIEKRIDGMYAQSYEALSRIIEQGREQDLFRKTIPVREQAAVIIALMDGMLLEWLRRNPSLIGGEIFRATRNTVLSGLLTDKGNALLASLNPAQ